MFKRPWLLALAAALGLIAVEACTDNDTAPTPPATAGSAGTSHGGSGGSSGASDAGTGAMVAGASNENAGQAGESTADAGAAGAAGSSDAGAAGAAMGGTAGAATGGTAGVGGTLTGGTAGMGGGASGGTAGMGGATSFTLQTTTLGQVIATSNGLSLYVLTTDTPGTSTAAPVTTCSGTCLGVWPLYYATPISVPTGSGLLASDFGSYDRGSGVLQSTYKGRPLYRYTLDTAVGDVKGEGISSKWYTAKSPFALP